MHTMDMTRVLHEKLELDMAQPIQPQLDALVEAKHAWDQHESTRATHDMSASLHAQSQQQHLIQSILAPSIHHVNGHTSPLIPATPLAVDSGSDSEDASRPASNIASPRMASSNITSPRNHSREMELHHQVEMLHEMMSHKERAIKELQGQHAQTQEQVIRQSVDVVQMLAVCITVSACRFYV